MRFIRTRYGLSLVLLVTLGTASCAGILSWATVYSSRAPDGKAELRVQETGCFADCALRPSSSNRDGVQRRLLLRVIVSCFLPMLLGKEAALLCT